MEMTEYVPPKSWDDKDMNWNTPDPTNADYIMAIRQALLERCAVLQMGWGGYLRRISPWRTVSRSVVECVLSTIYQMAEYFVNVDWEDYGEDFSDFPKKWTYGDLVQQKNCRLYQYAKYGSLVENGGDWLKQVRNAIDKLTVIRAGRVFGRTLTRSGAEHDPPFDESIGTAMRLAMDTLTERVYNGSFPSSVYAWSGNTHWKCPRPDFEGDPEDNKDGYCGYAQCQGYRITRVQSWLADAEFDLFAGILATEPTGAVPYSQQLDTSVFDGGEGGFKRGVNWTRRVHVKDPHDVDFTLGYVGSIPQNQVVPSSEFDGEGVAIRRHSAKRGWIGASYGFLDYGVEGGFKFRAKESS